MQQASSKTYWRLFWVATIVFFLSGGTGLAYQVIWFKRFAHVWGSSSLAFAAVSGSFLFGLGLGAYLFGRIADRIQRPLFWYGACEIAIGALAIVIPLEIQALVEASISIYASIPEQPLLRYLTQLCLTLLVTGPPCVLMGGTLPLLIRQLTSREGSLDQATGWLYAINTFGAATGCILAGFLLLPEWGLLGTNNAAATLNIGIGLASILISRASMQPRVARKSERVEETPQPTAAPRGVIGSVSLFGVFIAATLSGLASLMLEMTWSRQLALVLGGSTYAYTSTLFVVLVGIALGSLIYHLGLRWIASYPWVPLAVVGLLVVWNLIGYQMLPALSQGAGSARPDRLTLLGNAWVCVRAAMAVQFIPAICMGILFPLLVHLTRQSAAAVGRTVGDIYAWNTFGSIAGAALTAVLLFPSIGTAGAIGLATVCYAVVIFCMVAWQSVWGLAAGTVGAAAAAGIAWFIASNPHNPLQTNLGMYMYGEQVFQKDNPNYDVVFFKEGASSNVLVCKTRNTPTPSLSLRVNGKVDASDGLDMVTQAGLGYFPFFFKPDAKNVLVIGFGSGTTSGVCLLFPETNVTCCEIEPFALEAAPNFAHINHRPYEKRRSELLKKAAELPADQRPTAAEINKQARFNVIFGDGRTTLQGSDQKFDLIISEPSNPWLAGVGNLFTKEFFRTAKEHLADDGVLAQWIQTYNFTLSDYLTIVRTLRTEFPHCGMVSVANGADTILLASKRPLVPDKAALVKLHELIRSIPEMEADLQKWFGTTDPAVLLVRHYTLDEQTLVRLTRFEKLLRFFQVSKLGALLDRLHKITPDELHRLMQQEDLAGWFGTSDRSAILSRLQRIDEAALAKAIADHEPEQLNTDLNLWLEFDAPQHLFAQPSAADSAAAQLQAAREETWFRQLGKVVGLDVDTADYFVALGTQYRIMGDLKSALNSYQEAIKLRGSKGHPEAYRGIAAIHIQNKGKREAIAVLHDLLKIHPNDVEALDVLVRLHLDQNQNDEAVAVLRRLTQLQPANEKARFVLSEVLLRQNKHADAVPELRMLLTIRPNSAPYHANLAQSLLMLKQNSEAADEFRQALKLQPDVTPGSKAQTWANNLAWLLSTNSDDSLRNGAEAVDWATKAAAAAAKAHQLEPDFLDTLAAAYAEAGQFDKAIETSYSVVDKARSEIQILRERKYASQAEKQVAEGRAAHLTKLIDTTNSRIELYKASKPFRET
ncbi:MAG: fused MFS/spermidine synthase [Pirellulales bacterium]|nr:fused MFS/spermidine synthase [Pirellulales bacterium]